MANQYCVECDREFKSITGLNGHNQFKHNKLPGSLVTNNPTGRTTEILGLMNDQIEGLRLEIQGLREDLELESGELDFICENCADNGDNKQYLSPNQKECPNCETALIWETAKV